MDNEKIINEALALTEKCDEDFLRNIFSLDNAKKAREYLTILKKIKKENDSTILNATIKKLSFIIKQIDAANYHTYQKESILNLVSLSVTDYIINLIKNKHLLDPLLIARYAYIELAKVLYYDISYVKQTDLEAKRKICSAPVNVKKEKIFSYVVCTQWLKLYTYILDEFGIEVIKRNNPGEDHVWGEIKLNDKQIIIVDATDYINSSIDLSNAKSMSPTVGFVVLPSEYSNIKLFDIFNNSRNNETAKKIRDYYELNRDIDKTLGYIVDKYPVEEIIAENELFHYGNEIISNSKDSEMFLRKAMSFFRKIKIPNNMDGYEIYAYYMTFIKKLPLNIRANINEETLYVDSFNYKIKKLHTKFLQAPHEYLEYLYGLIYSRYYKYLTEKETNNFLEQMKNGVLDGEQIRDLIAKNELVIAEINRNINSYYAINKLQFFEPMTSDTLAIQLFEPMMGTKIYKDIDEYNEFKKTIVLK